MTLTPVNTAALVTQVKGHQRADPSLLELREKFYQQAKGYAFAPEPALLELRRDYYRVLPQVIAAMKAK